VSPGKGTQVWKKSGAVYEGDWKFGKRDGYGSLSHPDPETGKLRRVYSGWWKGDKKSVSGFPACLVCRRGEEPGFVWGVGGEGGRWTERQWLAGWEKEGVEGGTVVLFKRKQETREVAGPRKEPFKNLTASRRQQAVSPTLFLLVSWLSSSLTQF
jgi:hypothetical protein